MKNTNLFVLLLFTRWIHSIHGQLSWSLDDCELFYDRSDAFDTTSNTACNGQRNPPMPCSCRGYDPQYKDPLIDNNPSTTLHLSDNSWIDYIIKLPLANFGNISHPDYGFWELSKVEFAWGPAQDLPLDPVSQVYLTDVNTLTDHSLTWYDTYNSGTGLNKLILNPANNIFNYGASKVRFN
eukprot:256226_1